MTKKNDQTEAEIWAPCQFIRQDGIVEIFPNYEVSNLGRVRSLNYHRTGKIKVMKNNSIAKSNRIYRQVLLRKGNVRYTRKVHRLVLSSFDSKGYFKGAVVDHIDSGPSNNRLSNLRWVTYQENNSTLHSKESKSKALTNRADQSKRVKVTFLDDGHSEIFLSANEADRVLGLPKRTVASYISQYCNHYKKLNVLFEYI